MYWFPHRFGNAKRFRLEQVLVFGRRLLFLDGALLVWVAQRFSAAIRILFVESALAAEVLVCI